MSKLTFGSDNFDVELVFTFPFLEPENKFVRVILPSSGTIQGCTLVSEPARGSPRSEEWCKQYGIITEELLSQGIIEKRPDDTMVVYRKFRRDPNILTPFGAWKHKHNTVHSCSGLTVYTKEEYERLEKACCAVKLKDVTVSAKPLLAEKNGDVRDAKSVDIHVRCPAIVSEPPPVAQEAPPDPNLIDIDGVYENTTV